MNLPYRSKCVPDLVTKRMFCSLSSIFSYGFFFFMHASDMMTVAE